jgi:hypothetical protein
VLRWVQLCSCNSVFHRATLTAYTSLVRQSWVYRKIKRCEVGKMWGSKSWPYLITEFPHKNRKFTINLIEQPDWDTNQNTIEKFSDQRTYLELTIHRTFAKTFNCFHQTFFRLRIPQKRLRRTIFTVSFRRLNMQLRVEGNQITLQQFESNTA